MNTWLWLIVALIVIIILLFIFSAGSNGNTSRAMMRTYDYWIDQKEKKVVLVRSGQKAETVTEDIPVKSLQQGDYITVEFPIYSDAQKSDKIGLGIYSGFIFDTDKPNVKAVRNLGSHFHDKGHVYTHGTGFMIDTIDNYKHEFQVHGGNGIFKNAKGAHNIDHKPIERMTKGSFEY